MKNPKFLELLEQMKEIHEKKSHDYAQDNNVFSNFEYAELVAKPFEGIHKVFATMVGIKLARLGELLTSGKVPNNEAVNDSFVDACNYAAIWASYNMTKEVPAIIGVYENLKDRKVTIQPQIDMPASKIVFDPYRTPRTHKEIVDFEEPKD